MPAPPAGSVAPWNAFALPWIVVGILLMALAVVIYRRQRASRVALLFCWMIGLVAVWFGGFAGMLLAHTATTAGWWARVALVAVCLLPAAIYDFTVTALRLSVKRRPIRSAIYALAALFALITLFTNGVIGSLRPHSWGWYPVAGRMLAPFLAFFFAVLLGQLAEGLIEQCLAT